MYDDLSAVELLSTIKEKKEKDIAKGLLYREKESDYKYTELNEDKILVKLGDYCYKITDYVASGSFASLKENVKITNNEDYAIMVKTADFSNGFTKDLTYTDKKGYDFLKNSNLFGGELILSNIGSIGKVFKVPHLNVPMTLASNTVMLKFTDDSLSDYMYYYFLSPKGFKSLKKISSGTSMQKFNKTDLKKVYVPIYSTKTQKTIVEEFKKIDEAINNRESAISELNNLVYSKYFDMFKKNYDANDYHLLRDVCDLITDGTHQTPEYVEEGGVIFLSSKDVTTKRIVWDGVKHIPEKLHLELQKRVSPKKDDILLAKNGTTGISAIVDRDEVFDIYVSLCLIRVNSDINPKFMLYQLNSYKCKNQFDRSLKGIGVPNLHLNKIRETKVIKPERELQDRFVSYVEKIEKAIDVLTDEINNLNSLKLSKMNEYFN